MFVNLLVFVGFVYLRIATVWLTIESIKKFHCGERNILLKEAVEGNTKLLIFTEGLMIIGFAFLSLVIFVPNPLYYALILVLLFILWIDFQHDWETYVIMKELFKSKDFRKLIKKGTV